MLSPDKTGLLKSFLGALPGSMAARLATAVEVDRMMDGKALPHDDILESLRPVLRDQNARTLTPLRLFCHPFQDLLSSLPRRSKQKGVIARRSLEPVWNWVSKTLLPEESASYYHNSKALIVATKDEKAFARAAEFWPLAAAAMSASLKGAAPRKALENVQGDTLSEDDAGEMALLLS